MTTRHLIPSIIFSLILGCGGGGGGGGGSSAPTPSLSTNLPPSAFQDERLVITVNARNFGAGEITYNATSNSLGIEQGSAANQFVITDVDSLGNHTITFSASSTSGSNATLNSTIRIDVVPTGYWQVTSIDGQDAASVGAYLYSVVTRNGRVFSGASTDQGDGTFVDEKCMGSHSISGSNLSFESWCVDTVDGVVVDEENYRLTGDVTLDVGGFGFGTYSVYDITGAEVFSAPIELRRFDSYINLGLSAPQSATGIYWGPTDMILEIDNVGNITTTVPGTDGCVVQGSAPRPDKDFNLGIFDAPRLEQTSCNASGNWFTGNRDIAAGEGILEFRNGAYFSGGTFDDELLLIMLTESVNSYTGIPSVQPFFRLCTAGGELTPFAGNIPWFQQCSTQ